MFRELQNDCQHRVAVLRGMESGPSATARSAVASQALSRSVAEVRHVLRQHFDPPDQLADIPMKPFSPTSTPPDIVCLYGARALRGFGDGFAILVLPVYLSAVGFSPQQIGIVASACCWERRR
jgi:hypothetical protein